MSKNNRSGGSLPLSISQNFLTSGKTIDRLLRLSSICKEDYVVEIGPGKGHITKALAMRADKVRAVEIDKSLYEKLSDKLSDLNNVSIINRDFLKTELPKIDYKVFSNIPFCRTSEIIEKLTSAKNPPKDAWLVMEKGAAKRFSGKPSETASSLSLKPFFKTEIVYHFSREDFHPSPSVDTVLFHITKKKEPDILPGQRAEFERFISKCKKYGVKAVLSKRQIERALKLAELPGIPESGVLLYVQWLCLFRCCMQLGIRNV